MKNSILILIFLFPYTLLADQAEPQNWSETLHAALTLNSKPREKDALLLAQKQLTHAAKDGMLPTVTLNSSYSASPTSTLTQTYDGQNWSSINQNSNPNIADLNLSLNWNIFQCGLQYYTYKAAQVNEKILADEFNSTQFFITNTKGNVVASSFQAYSSLIKLDEELTVFVLIQKYLNKLTSIAEQDPDAKASLATIKAQLQSTQTTLDQSRKSAIEVFTHWVTLPPSSKINSLEDAIVELNIPKESSEAFKIAKQQSPDVKQAADQVQFAQYQIKIAQAALCPQVNLSAVIDRNWDTDKILQQNTRTFSQTFAISISLPIFNLPNYDNINYQKKLLIADKLAQQAALDDAEFSIKQTYEDLENQNKNQQDTEQIVKALKESVQMTENDIDNQKRLPDPKTSGAVNSYISVKLQIINNLLNSWIQLSAYRGQILQDKFSILQAMGTIFDEESTLKLPKKVNSD